MMKRCFYPNGQACRQGAVKFLESLNPEKEDGQIIRNTLRFIGLTQSGSKCTAHFGHAPRSILAMSQEHVPMGYLQSKRHTHCNITSYSIGRDWDTICRCVGKRYPNEISRQN